MLWFRNFSSIFVFCIISELVSFQKRERKQVGLVRSFHQDIGTALREFACGRLSQIS